MRKILSIACVAALAAGCATVGQVKALEKRMNSLEKKVAKVDAVNDTYSERLDNIESRLKLLEQSIDAVISEMKRITEEKGQKPPRVPK